MQKYVHQNRFSYYFAYIKLVHELCRTRISKDCSGQALKSLFINETIVEQCIAGTFTGPDKAKASNTVYAEHAQ